MKAILLTTAAVVALLSGAAQAQTEPYKNARAVQEAAARITVGTCTTNLFQREGWSNGQKVAVVPLYDRDPYLALACAGTLTNGDRDTRTSE